MSSMGLDLRGVEKFVRDQILIDDALVERTNGAAEDQLDEETGQLVGDPPAQVFAGKAAIQSLSGFTEVDSPDIARIVETTEANYRMLTVLAVSFDPVVGDMVRLTALGSRTPDPTMLRRRFQVVDLGGGNTHSVYRVTYLKQIALVDAGSTPPAPGSPGGVTTGEGPPDEDTPTDSLYLDEDTGDIYEWTTP